PPPFPPGPTLLSVRAGKVGDELVELGVGLRDQAALEALLELVAVEASVEVVPAQDLADRLALAVAHAQLAIARAATPVVTDVVRSWHVSPFSVVDLLLERAPVGPRRGSRAQASGSSSARRA